jgi:hypothetical protein
LKKLFLILTSLVCFVSASADSKWKEEVDAIDRQIEDLKELQRGYEGRALSHENQAELLQFKQGELPNARRQWMLADENRVIAEKIQQDIDDLEKKKQQILEKHSGEK